MLPAEVMARANSEFQDWNGVGMSVMEMSHRSEEYLSIVGEAEADLRALLSIPENYHVLFLQGGASGQFSMVPMNLLAKPDEPVDYLNTGIWSSKAIAEAKRYADVNIVASSENQNFTNIPAMQEWNLNPEARYVHYTPNETIGGLEFHWIPDTGAVPLVADMSSTLLSRPIDVSKFGLIYAGAQKNIGPAGLTLVIVREDLLSEPMTATPTTMNYRLQAKQGSMLNTPPTYAWYMAGLVFQWIRQQGGLIEMERLNRHKAQRLYAAIDGSDLYSNAIETESRSWMNVPFKSASPALDGKFLTQAAARGLLNLKGHRSVGGMRASIYNAMPLAGVEALIDFMGLFESTQ